MLTGSHNHFRKQFPLDLRIYSWESWNACTIRKSFLSVFFSFFLYIQRLVFHRQKDGLDPLCWRSFALVINQCKAHHYLPTSLRLRRTIRTRSQRRSGGKMKPIYFGNRHQKLLLLNIWNPNSLWAKIDHRDFVSFRLRIYTVTQFELVYGLGISPGAFVLNCYTFVKFQDVGEVLWKLNTSSRKQRVSTRTKKMRNLCLQILFFHQSNPLRLID